MQREQLHSEHAAICFLEAKRKSNKMKKQLAKTLPNKKSDAKESDHD